VCGGATPVPRQRAGRGLQIAEDSGQERRLRTPDVRVTKFQRQFRTPNYKRVAMPGSYYTVSRLRL